MIESITLQGFKSFAERSRLDFGKGISAVIGPNGSGKSNVVEALRWATQQARARELRANKATELIFHGSGGKAPLGMAEVQLELRTQQGQLSLSRRLYRDGTSEQDLGGQAARVRDIHAALRGSGLGPGGLAVIGQGEVSNVVQAEGKTLLGYLSEAAGLSRAVAVREETSRRLVSAEQALVEVQRLETERLSRLTRLAAEAESAKNHRQWSLRQLALQEAVQRQRQETLATELNAQRRKAADLEQQSMQLSQQTVQLATQVELSRETLRTQRSQEAHYQQALELLKAAEAAKAQQKQYLSHLESEHQSLHGQQAALKLTQPLTPAPNLAEQQATLKNTRAELSRLEQLTERARRQYAEEAERHTRASTQRQLLETELHGLRLASEDQLSAVQQAQAQLSEAQAAELLAEQLKAQLSELKRQLSELKSQLSAVLAARAPLLREQRRLEDLLNSYSRYGEGPRNALMSNHAGIIGSVAELIRVSAEYQLAASTALGRRLEQVVVENADDAKALIELLKRLGGRATFLPLDLLNVRPRRDAALANESGVIGNLADLCPSDPPQVSQALLSDTLIMQDLSAATRLARRFANRPRLVTLDGEVLEPGGAMTGGRLSSSGSPVLADQRRFEELDIELSELKANEDALNLSGQRLQAELSALPAKTDTSQAALRLAERQLTQLETALSSAKRRQHDLATRLAQLSSLTPSNTQDPAQLQEQLGHLRGIERQQAEQLSAARELQSAWTLYQSHLAQHSALQLRLEANTQALSQHNEQQQHSAEELHRRRLEAEQGQPQQDVQAEQRHQQLSTHYATVLAQHNTVRANLEQAKIGAARREGSLEELPDGAQIAGNPKTWQSELSRLGQQLTALGPINALAEDEHADEQRQLNMLQAERQDAQQAAHELRGHLHQLSEQEQLATRAAYSRVNAAFADYSRELLGGEGQLEAEMQDGQLTGLSLSVQPKGKRTRSMNLLSAGERTMAGLGFLFALNHAAQGAQGGLPLAVLDEVDAPLDEANIRRFTHFLQVFADKGAQFIVVTHQKATMEVAHAIWGVTTDHTGASRILSIKQEG